MTRVYSKALDKTITVERILGHVQGNTSGPTLVFIAGIHGNEPAGLFALQQVLQEIERKAITLKGNLYALSGNLWALAHGKRYQVNDLNRLWTEAQMLQSKTVFSADMDADRLQQRELDRAIHEILENEEGPFYFMDLHTTSGATSPFLTVNDSLLNRRFTRQFPAPMILGIEEYLQGPMLSYLNLQGFVSFGFEAGQHDAPEAIENHVAFIYLSLVFAGCIEREAIDFTHYFQLLARRSPKSRAAFEIIHRYAIKPGEAFEMLPGFSNFQPIGKGEALARRGEEIIYAPYSGKIFMPLYQPQGEDGFFIIRPIPRLALQLSAILRKLRIDRVLPLLPGIRWASPRQDELKVNLRVARFLAKDVFHLLGYRSRRLNHRHILIRKRDGGSRELDYHAEAWNTARQPSKS